MKNLRIKEKDGSNTLSQEKKKILKNRGNFEKVNNDINMDYPKDILMCFKLGIEFWDLDKPSQNKLIKEITVRILKLEGGL